MKLKDLSSFLLGYAELNQITEAVLIIVLLDVRQISVLVTPSSDCLDSNFQF